MSVVTFQLRGCETTVNNTLTGLGFVFGPSRTVTTNVLDTFDGRLHHGGLRLQLVESDDLELVLSGEGTAPAHLVVKAAPSVRADFPPGPLRSRIAAVIDERVLMQQLRVGTTRTIAARHDASGKVVVTAELFEKIHVVDPADVDRKDVDRKDVDRNSVDWPEATVELHEVPGYRKQTLRARAALRKAGVPECATDTLTQCAAAAGVDLGGFTAAATVALDPQMPAIDGFRLVLSNLAEAIVANWQGTVDHADPEFLHDLRIAVRRTRTILSEAKAVLPAAVLEPAKDGFAWLGGLTGEPRDLDVYLLEWSRYTDPLGSDVVPSLEPVRYLLERRRSAGHLGLERGLRSERAIELIDTWSAWLRGPVGSEELPRHARRPLGRLVARRIAHAHGTLVDGGRLVGPDTPAEQIHELRKDAKKLRYLLECFGSLLHAGACKHYVKRLKALQDNLGEHQDAEVHVSMLHAIAREFHDAGAAPDTMAAIAELTDRLDRKRLAARAEFAERFAEYDTPGVQQALDTVLEGITV